MAFPGRVMTAEELFRLPDDNCRYALVGGELQRMNPAGFDHGAVTRSDTLNGAPLLPDVRLPVGDIFAL